MFEPIWKQQYKQNLKVGVGCVVLKKERNKMASSDVSNYPDCWFDTMGLCHEDRLTPDKINSDFPVSQNWPTHRNRSPWLLTQNKSTFPQDRHGRKHYIYHKVRRINKTSVKCLGLKLFNWLAIVRKENK